VFFVEKDILYGLACRLAVVFGKGERQARKATQMLESTETGCTKTGRVMNTS
jgi:hypothetical protein